MSRVVVAGATGYLGKHIVAELKRQGHWVRALARDTTKFGQKGPFLEPAVCSSIDDGFQGEATLPETLEGLCDDADAVISSLGITRQSDKLSFRDVDYQANRNILDRALEAGVTKFVFVSIFQPELLAGIGMVQAREDFVKDLRASGLDVTVIRPTGFFSDMSEFFHMARSGRVWLIGNGKARINPIHGADLAEACVNALGSREAEIQVGGPDTYTFREMSEVAFSVLAERPKVTRIPGWFIDATLRLVKPFSGRYYDLGRFFATVCRHDFVAPAAGSRTLPDYYRQLLEVEERKASG